VFLFHPDSTFHLPSAVPTYKPGLWKRFCYTVLHSSSLIFFISIEGGGRGGWNWVKPFSDGERMGVTRARSPLRYAVLWDTDLYSWDNYWVTSLAIKYHFNPKTTSALPSLLYYAVPPCLTAFLLSTCIKGTAIPSNSLQFSVIDIIEFRHRISSPVWLVTCTVLYNKIVWLDSSRMIGFISWQTSNYIPQLVDAWSHRSKIMVMGVDFKIWLKAKRLQLS